MSGHKRTTVSLSEADLRRLEGVEGRLRNVEKDYESIRERAKQAQAEELLEGWQGLSRRQTAFQETLASALGEVQEGVYGELQELEAQSGQALAEQALYLQEQMAGLGSGMWEQTAALLEAHSRQVADLVQASQEEREAQFGRLRRELREGRQSREQMAAEALQAAQGLWASLAESLPVERYAPGSLERSAQTLEQAWENLSQGMAEAGLVGAQQVIGEQGRLRVEVEGLEWRRTCLLAAVKRQVRELVEIGHRQARVGAVGLDGEELGIEIDVSYWSGGRYGAALGRAQGLLEQVERQGEAMSADELFELQAEKLKEAEWGLEEAVYWARRNVLASQVRYNIAGCVVQALEDQGFALSGGSYAGSDQRGAYQALLKHLDGSEVVVQVSEVEGEIGTSQVDLETLDAEQRTKHELRQRAREVAASLSTYGLQVGRAPSPLSQPETPSPSGRGLGVRERRVSYGRN